MPLTTPIVTGSISELSRTVRVEGLIPGAKFRVSTLGPRPRVLVDTIASTSEVRVDLPATESLSSDDILVAEQELDSERSPKPEIARGQGVQAVPASALGHVGYVSRLYECSRRIWVGGAIPGATVEVRIDGTLVGVGEAEEGQARLSLSRTLTPGVPVAARQVASPLPPGPDTWRDPESLPVYDGDDLPAPTILQPLKGCQEAVAITNIFDGAWVRLTRGSGITQDFPTDLNALWLVLDEPLEKGDTLTASQDFIDTCKRSGEISPKVLVGPPEPVDPPAFDTLCAGADTVRLYNLRPMARVTITLANGVAYQGQAASNRNWSDFLVEPLPAGPIWVTQTVCDITSPPAQGTVTAHPAITVAPELVAPLYACARGVSVRRVHPGAWLRVVSKDTHAGPLTGWEQLPDPRATEGFLHVAPYLTPDDSLTVEQLACGGALLRADAVRVEPHPQINAPTPDRIIINDIEVRILDTLPGALVELYVGDDNEQFTYIGQAVASARGATVRLPAPASRKDRYRARQLLCKELSPFGPAVRPVVPPPLTPVDLTPANGSSWLRPTGLVLAWRDPEVSQPRTVRDYTLRLSSSGGDVVPPTTVRATQFTIPGTLTPDTEFTWTVAANNDTGTSAPAVARFRTKPLRPSVRYDTAKFILTGTGFMPRARVNIQVTVIGPLFGIANSRRTPLPLPTTTADGMGRIEMLVDLRSQAVLPWEYFPDLGYWVEGAGVGQKVTILANDGREDPPQSGNEFWSDPFIFTAQ